jgi:hypothetical protein
MMGPLLPGSGYFNLSSVPTLYAICELAGSRSRLEGKPNGNIQACRIGLNRCALPEILSSAMDP